MGNVTSSDEENQDDDFSLNSSQCSDFRNTHYWLIPAVLFAVLISFLNKRQSECALDRKIPLNRRFGLPVPLQILSTHSNRWGFALAFGATANLILDRFINGQLLGCLLKVPQYATVLLYFLVALEVAMVHYPIFICLTVKNRIVGNLLGFVYSLGWLSYQVVKSYGQLTSNYLFGDLPSFICCAFLVLRFLNNFIKHLTRWLKSDSQNQNQKSLVALNHNIEHVKRLLQPRGPIGKKHWFKKLVYEFDPCFRYPARIIIVVVLSLCGVYTISFLAILAAGKYSSYIGTTYPSLAIAMTAIVTIFHILTIMSQYRNQVMSLYKGDRRGLPKKLPSSDAIMARSLMYIGMQVAYACSSIAILNCFFFAVVLLIDWVIIEPIILGNTVQMLLFLVNVGGNTVFLLFIFLFLRAVARTFFLQEKLSVSDREKPLAIANIHALENTSYFSLFFYIIAGVMGSALRLLISLVLTIMTIARIDQTVLPSKLEGCLDLGYCSWVAMLIMDSTHNNPTALTFCYVLLQSSLLSDPELNSAKIRTASARMARRRWWLCYTLLKNPGLVFLRRQKHSLEATPIEQLNLEDVVVLPTIPLLS